MQPLPQLASRLTLGILVVQGRRHILRHISQRDAVLRQRTQALLARLQPSDREEHGPLSGHLACLPVC